MTKEEIQISGKTLISLKRASEVSGYAKDYIGQLCRAGKINSKRIGRDWFADIDDILSYKEKANKIKRENGLRIAGKLTKEDKAISLSWLPDFVPALGLVVLVLLLFVFSSDIKNAYAKLLEPTARNILYQVTSNTNKIVNGLENGAEVVNSFTEHSFSLIENNTKKLTSLSLTIPQISLPQIKIPKPDLSFVHDSVMHMARIGEVSGNLISYVGDKNYLISQNIPDINFEMPNIEIPNLSIKIPKPDLSFVRHLVANTADTALSFFSFFNEGTETIGNLAKDVANAWIMAPQNISELAQEFFGQQQTSIVVVQTPSVSSPTLGVEQTSDVGEKTSDVAVTKTIVEKTIERVISGLTSEELDAKLNQLNSQILAQMSGLKNELASQISANQNSIALTNRINNLGSVTISNPTFSGTVSGLTDADIPDSITASNYLPLSGGTITGVLTVTSSTTFNGITYGWPSSDGSANQVLATNGSGVLSWSTVSSSGGNTTWEINSLGNLAPTTTLAVYLPSKLYASSTALFDGAITVTSTSATSTFPYLAVSTNSNLGTIIGGVWQGTAIGAGYGGTGLTTYTPNQLLYASGASAIGQIATSSLGLLTTDVAEGTNQYYTDARARAAVSSTATGLTYTSGTGVFSLTSNYSIPLTASTTDWNSFWQTPSTRITAGDYIDWSGNTLNVVGTLPVSIGGTGLTSYTLGDVLYASGTGTLAGTTTANLKTTLGLNLVENTALSSWAGSANITTLGTIGTGAWAGTTIPVNKGGTGLTSWTLNQLLYASGTGTIGQIATSSLGLLTTDVTEGTNQYYTDARARAALSSTATGLTYTSGTGVFSLTAGYNIPLTASTTDWNSFWQTPSTRITAGDYIDWSGNTLNVVGTLPVSIGGTGLTSYTLGDVLYASGTGTLAGTSTANLKTTLGLNLVENTALSSWAGSANITTLGTIGTGVWNAGAITSSGAITGTQLVVNSTTATSTFSTGGLTVGTSQFVVQQTSGNVGIGITSPSALLDLVGNGLTLEGTATLDNATGDEVAYQLNYTTNKATSGNDTGLLINMTDTLSPGTSKLLDLQLNGTSKFSVSNAGDLITASNITAGTSGAAIVYGAQFRPGTINLTTYLGSNASISTANVNMVELPSVTGGFTTTSGTSVALAIKPTYNQGSGTAANTDLLINRTETAVGSGTQNLIDAQVGGVSKFSVDNLGNVGIGTTTPAQLLSVAGHCVTGDSELITEDGKTLRVDEVKGGEKILSLNEKTGELAPAKIQKLWDMGVKPIYKIETEDGKTIRTTAEHPYLAKLPLLFGENNQKDNGNSQEGPKNINVNHSIKNIIHNSLTNNKLNDQKIKDEIKPKISISQFNLPLIIGSINTEAKNTWPISREISDNDLKRADENNIIYLNNNIQQNPVNNTMWIKVIYLQEGDEIAVADDDLEGINFVKIKKITILSPEQVYDLSIESTHNFVANGIIAHNTYITGGLGAGLAETTSGNITGTGRLSITSTTATSTFSTGGLTVGTSQFVVQQTSGKVGIGTTTPWGNLSIEIAPSGYTFVVADTGTSTPLLYVDSGGITYIENLQTGPMSFSADAGTVTWMDMPVTTASASSTLLSYTAKIDATSILTVSALSDGAGGVNSWAVGIGTSTPMTPSTYGLLLAGKTAYCDQASCWVSASSRSLKTNITELTDENIQEVLTQIASTSVYFYNMNYDPNGRIFLGVISEEAPDWITSPDKMGISGEAFANFLMAGMKGVLAEISNFKLQISNLGDRLTEGIIKIKEIISDKITTKQFCIEGDDDEKVCIDKNQLKTILENNNVQDTSPLITPEPEIMEAPAEEVAPSEENIEATTTPEEINP